MRKFLLLAAVTMTACSEDETVPRATTDAAADTSTSATDTSSPVDTSVEESAVTADSGADDAADAADVAETSLDAGTAADCLDPTVYAGLITALDDKKCVVAMYTADTGGVSATWGRHGGPLAFSFSGGEATLTRYEPPATAATGALTTKTQKVAVASVPSSVFWTPTAIDLPFFGWTGFAYTGTGAAGEVIFVDSTGLRARYKMRGLYDFAGVAAGVGGRLLYTGLSELATGTTPTTNESALWAADSCGTTSTTPRLLPEGDSSCKAPVKVGTWQPATGSSGSVAADPLENVFAVLNGTARELRGFERSTVAKGAPPATGVSFATSSTEYFQNVAADGKQVFYRTDGWPAANVDVMARAYTVDAGAKTLSAGATTTLLKLTRTGSTSLFVDSSRRLWLGVESVVGDAAATTTFLVIRDKSP
jgi:hypothetical protein